MTRLVRYIGPRRAYIGAIGEQAPGGARINGRHVNGQVAAVGYAVTRDGERLCERASWEDGLIALCFACGGERVAVTAPQVAGLEIVAADAVYRLDPV